MEIIVIGRRGMKDTLRGSTGARRMWRRRSRGERAAYDLNLSNEEFTAREMAGDHRRCELVRRGTINDDEKIITDSIRTGILPARFTVSGHSLPSLRWPPFLIMLPVINLTNSLSTFRKRLMKTRIDGRSRKLRDWVTPLPMWSFRQSSPSHSSVVHLADDLQSVPPVAVAALIGPKGSMIRTINSKTGAYSRIDRSGPLPLLNIFGDKKQVTKIFDLMDPIIKQYDSTWTGGMRASFPLPL